MGPIVLAVVVGAAGWAIYKAATGGFSDAQFTIKVGPGGADLSGTVPGKSRGDVVAFVESLGLPTGSKIVGVLDRGSLVMRFSGPIPENLQQRMRNYFMN